MEEAPQHPDYDSPAKVELERLKTKYRRVNIANDKAREQLEEQLAWYDEEQADEMSRNFEEGCRQVLEPIEKEIQEHARRHNLRIG